MLTVRFRPHRMSLLSIEGGGYNNALGDYTPGVEKWSGCIPCRYEPNGHARTVPVGEGKNYVYEYTVYLNTDCPEVQFGQQVRLYDGRGNCIGQFASKGFHRGQLDAKLWV